MDNFDLRKYLVENKVTTNSRMMNEAYREVEDNLEILKNCIALGEENRKWKSLKGEAERIYQDFQETGDEENLDEAVELMLDDYQPPQSVLGYETHKGSPFSEEISERKHSKMMNEYLEDEGSVQDAFTEAGIEDSDMVTLTVSMFREEETLDPMPASEAINYIEEKSKRGKLERQYSFDDLEDNGALININLGDEISIDVFTDREIIKPSQAPRDPF